MEVASILFLHCTNSEQTAKQEDVDQTWTTVLSSDYVSVCWILFTETWSLLFRCNSMLFVTSWLLFCFLFQNGLQDKIKHCPTHSNHQRKKLLVRCVAVQYSSCGFSTFWVDVNTTAFSLSVFSCSLFYCIDSPVLCKGHLSTDEVLLIQNATWIQFPSTYILQLS